jgi:hypothetical protein
VLIILQMAAAPWEQPDASARERFPAGACGRLVLSHPPRRGSGRAGFSSADLAKGAQRAARAWREGAIEVEGAHRRAASGLHCQDTAPLRQKLRCGKDVPLLLTSHRYFRQPGHGQRCSSRA